MQDYHDPAARPSPYERDSNGTRRPSIWADPDVSGASQTLIPWHLQWRLLMTLRADADFRREMREALGL